MNIYFVICESVSAYFLFLQPLYPSATSCEVARIILLKIIGRVYYTLSVNRLTLIRLFKKKGNSDMGFKSIISQMDFFSHSQFLRYNNNETYRTFTGGITSILIITLFVGIFFNTMMNTFDKKIIVGSSSTKHQPDPTSFQIKANAQNNFLFMVGIQNLDLASKKQFFSIKVDQLSITKNRTGLFRNQTSIKMVPCTIDHFEGGNQQITASFHNIGLSKWLCPPKNYEFSFEGKFTSENFRYVRIFVEKCVPSNTTECATTQEIDEYITKNEGGTVYTYFLNTVINHGDSKYLNQFIEDSNYFTFNTVTGVTSNIFFDQYDIETDNSLLPTTDFSDDRGLMLKVTAYGQPYTVTSSNRYAKIYLRKSSSNIQVTRSFQKLHETLSFIGGLYSTAILLMFVIAIYDRYSYELDFGDKIFKRDNNTSYGSESFNLLIFFGYNLFSFLLKCGYQMNWPRMKIIHECRRECLKQLDFNLLMKKIDLFQEVSWLVLEEHHLRGLYLIPRKPIKEVKKIRKRHMMQNLIYHQLQKKGRLINVQKQAYEKRCEQFLQKKKKNIIKNKQNIICGQQHEDQKINAIHKQLKNSYWQIAERSKLGDAYSKRILQKIEHSDLLSIYTQKTNPIDDRILQSNCQIVNHIGRQELVIYIGPDRSNDAKNTDLKDRSSSISKIEFIDNKSPAISQKISKQSQKDVSISQQVAAKKPQHKLLVIQTKEPEDQKGRYIKKESKPKK